MKKSILIAVVALVLGAVAGRAEDAKALYDKQCAKCHGTQGKGDTKMGKKLGAKDYTDPKVQAELKDEEAFKAIKEGLKDKAGKTQMKAFNDLSDAEIKALIAHMRAFKK